MKFNKLYEIIKEAVRFVDLPETMEGYYGFWISPEGEINLVKGWQDHAKDAKKIILNNEFYKKKYMENMKFSQYDKNESHLKDIYPPEFKDFLYVVLNYMRVARGREHRMFWASTHRKPTTKQVETLKDLGFLYDYKTHYEYF